MSQFDRKMLYPFVPGIDPSSEEENRQLKDENLRLKTRLNTQLTKDITVLPVIKAVECPAASKVVSLSQCKACDYFKNRIILTTMDGQGLENVYCAYRDRWIDPADLPEMSGDAYRLTEWKPLICGEFTPGDDE